MGDLTEDRSDRLGYRGQPSVVVPLRVGPPRRESLVEVAEGRRDVGVGRVVVQDQVGDPFEVRMSTIDRIQNGPSYSSSAAM